MVVGRGKICYLGNGRTCFRAALISGEDLLHRRLSLIEWFVLWPPYATILIVSGWKAKHEGSTI